MCAVAWQIERDTEIMHPVLLAFAFQHDPGLPQSAVLEDKSSVAHALDEGIGARRSEEGLYPQDRSHLSKQAVPCTTGVQVAHE